MTTLHQTHSAYAAPRAALRTPRGAEYDVFAQVTGRLRAAMVPDAPLAWLAGALHDNQVLWSTLAVDLAAPGNALPQRLRAQLFYLAEFTLQHSRKVLTTGADPAILVEINTAVMRGLRGDSGAGE